MTGALRLIDDLDTGIDAAGQMAADVAMLAGLAEGDAPALRLYRWSSPALSLGRFQPDDDVDRDACLRLGVDVVRRPTGGRGLLHGADLTYAVAMVRPRGGAGRVDSVYELLAGALIRGLATIGVMAAIARHDGPSGPVCFASQQGADLRVGERKLCGSAQLQLGNAVLQHGSVLLDRLPFDETDVLRPVPGASAGSAPDLRTRLRRTTVTLAELGAPTDARVVADALIEGFAATLDVESEAALDLSCR